MSPSTTAESAGGLPAGGAPPASTGSDWPAMPVETEIYLLPDGQVVVADLPVELSALLAALGAVEPGSPGVDGRQENSSVDDASG